MRDEFIELLEQALGQKNNDTPTLEEMADYLINALNGSVIIPPCKVGDTVYVLCRDYFSGDYKIKEETVEDFSYIGGCWFISTNEHTMCEFDIKVFTNYGKAMKALKD